MALIGISGKMQTGKDTLAAIITTISNYERVAFADKLKARIALTWDIDAALLNDQEFKKTLSPLGITWRELMQREGVMMRELDVNYWVKAALHNTNGKNVVVTDVRFPNEARAIINMGGILVRMRRDGVDTSNHISETALDDWNEWHFIYDNNRSKVELEEFARLLISSYRKF
jgi:hypothetical protein